MIDYGKLQADIVKNIYKSKMNAPKLDYRVFNRITVEDREYIPVMYKSFAVYLIPVDIFMLSQSIQADKSPEFLDTIFKNPTDMVQLIDTKTTRQVKDMQLREFMTQEGKTIFVNTKLLNVFGKTFTAYKGESDDVVYIKLGHAIEGLVLRVRVSDEDIKE